MPNDVRLAHSSDIHIDDERTGAHHSGLRGLRAVLNTAADHRAHLLLLAGDTFDNPRVPLATLHQAAALLATAAMPIVILPGNHDPLLPNCIFRRAGIADLPNISIFGIHHPDRFHFPTHDLEITGRPLISFDDMPPLHPPRPRQARHHVAMAHGHYVPPDEWHDQSHRSWKLSNQAIAETRADYLALGHWDRPTPAGDGTIPAYYSGSPNLAETLNLVRLGATTEVQRIPLRWD